ncbi:MAG: hypothetical protein HY812_01145 [Planctomycetes bacterium]|nr:hypothetical protein [Planctomycetota bacterium]
MRFTTLLLTACTLGLLAFGATAGDSVLRWKLDIKPDDSARNSCGRLTVQPAEGPAQVYWYFVYTIRNTHDQAVPLALHLRAETDANERVYSEGYYPRALAAVRRMHGADVKDVTALAGLELAAGETVRAVAIFQFRKPDSREFEEDVDHIKVRCAGYADPVKKIGLSFEKEDLELVLSYEKKGDRFDPHREPVRFVETAEQVAP